MGIFKVFIKFGFLFFFFGCFVHCKKQVKSIAEESAVLLQKKDTSIIIPEYVTKEYVLGKFDYAKNQDFVVVPKKLSTKKIYVRKEVLNAFLAMNSEAKKTGITFTIISGTRNFEHQKRIWNHKWNVKYKAFSLLKRVYKILEYSSMPSTSRHHWGTDIDVNSLNNAYFSTKKGKKEYHWLLANASKYGFYQVYTSKENGRTGYHEEKWHWSYLPLSSIYLKYYNAHITTADITGFKGAEFAAKINVIKEYVNGINVRIKK